MSLTLLPVTVVAVEDTDEMSDASEIGLKLTTLPFGGMRRGSLKFVAAAYDEARRTT